MSNEQIEQLRIQLEVVPEDQFDTDVVLMNEVASTMVQILKNKGYTVQTVVDPDRRAKGFPIQEILPAISTAEGMTHTVWDNREHIAETIKVLTGVVVAVKMVYDKFANKQGETRKVKVHYELDGSEITSTDIEAGDPKDVADVAKELQRSLEPILKEKLNPKSKGKVIVQVPRPIRRRRR